MIQAANRADDKGRCTLIILPIFETIKVNIIYLVIIHFSEVTLLFEQWIISKTSTVYSFVHEYMNCNVLLFLALKRVKHILGLSGIEPLLGLFNSTLTFEASI